MPRTEKFTTQVVYCVGIKIAPDRHSKEKKIDGGEGRGFFKNLLVLIFFFKSMNIGNFLLYIFMFIDLLRKVA